MKKRCIWAENNDLLAEYHDKEWGRLVKDDKKLFEFLVLESAQAGLNWLTILKKRNGYKKNFANFDAKKVAKYDRRKINSLLKDPSIIRNRMKIEAAVNNAARFLEIQKEFGSFYKYQISFLKNKKPIKHLLRKDSDYPTTIKEAELFAVDLKKRGFKFLGPTTIYAHMQATGMVDDHMTFCFRREK